MHISITENQFRLIGYYVGMRLYLRNEIHETTTLIYLFIFISNFYHTYILFQAHIR